MVTLAVQKGATQNLPRGGNFTVGLGWDPATAGADSPDLDIWVVRVKSSGDPEPCCWANQDWLRPDLGKNSEGSPFVASPEGDMLYKGDDRTGASSAGGYDEELDLDLTKAPANVTEYRVFITYYTDPGNPQMTLGMASNIVCGVKDNTSGNEVTTQLGSEFGFDSSALICTIARDPNGNWAMTAEHKGSQKSMFDIASDGYVVA